MASSLRRLPPTSLQQVSPPSLVTLCPEVIDWYASPEFRQLQIKTLTETPEAGEYLNKLVNLTINVIMESSMSTQDKYTEIFIGMIPIFGNDKNFQNEMVAGVLTERLVTSYSETQDQYQSQAQVRHQSQQSEIPTVPDINDDYDIEYIG